MPQMSEPFGPAAAVQIDDRLLTSRNYCPAVHSKPDKLWRLKQVRADRPSARARSAERCCAKATRA
jgi:hypothetical protein